MSNKEPSPNDTTTKDSVVENQTQNRGNRSKNFKMEGRTISVGKSYKEYGDNSISTSKYTFLTFVPLNLLEQFKKVANIYFVILTCMQFIPAITISDGIPTIIVPLSFVILVSMAKDFYEDLKRKLADREENNRKILKWDHNSSKFSTVSWRNLATGDFVKVKSDEAIGADLLILFTTSKKKDCFVMTKNLDGETNLKNREVPIKLKSVIKTDEDFMSAIKGATYTIEAPNSHLDSFAGSLATGNELISIDNTSILLRGCVLKNTDFVIGLVTFVGRYSKIMQNTIKTKPKKSDLERKMQIQILIVFSMLATFCATASFLYIMWYTRFKEDIDYIGLGDLLLPLEFFIRIGNWILIFGNFVPISLLVTIETVKFIQGIIISADETMYTEKCDSKVIVQSSNLNEELGQISYVFSDKTGTLTQNEMIFKKAIIEGVAYGNKEDESARQRMKEIDNVNFWDESFLKNLNTDHNVLYCKFLAICHSIIVDDRGDEISYSSPSPDEIALANFARFCGTEYRGVDEYGSMEILLCGEVRKYKKHYDLGFTSTRQRQSIIFEEDNGDVWLFTKGADSKIFSLTKPEYLQRKEVINLKKNLDKFATEGLRTLVLGVRKIGKGEWESWKAKYEQASNLILKREETMRALQAEIEVNLYIIGATAIEDRLQDEVPETIHQLKRAGVRVWVLTGDKPETAKTIGFSCNLLQTDMTTYEILTNQPEEIESKIQEALIEIKSNARNGISKKMGILITGKALITVFKNKQIEKDFNEVAQACEAVLCCRVSPLQKQQVVKMVKSKVPLARTLSIGDGANDVQMITAAHVGIGIKGVEGQQAARASDYAIGEFKHLRKLIFVYGRECYRRNTILVLYSFYKNIVLVMPQFWYAIVFQNLSGVTLYDSFLYQFVNIFYTSFPIVIYAVSDRDTDYELLLNSHKYYFPGIKEMFFNNIVFWQWFTFGVAQAFLICFLTSISNYGPQSDGNYLGFWGYGIIVFTAAILVPNLKVLTFSYSYSFINLLGLFLSIFLFVLSFFIVNNFSSNDHYGTFFTIYFNLKTVVVLFIVCLFTYHLDNMFTKFQYAVFFTGAEPPSRKPVKDNSSFEEIRLEGNVWNQVSGPQQMPANNMKQLFQLNY